MRISEYIFELKEEALMDQSKKKIKLLPRPNKIHKSECLLTTSGFMYQEFEHPSYLHNKITVFFTNYLYFFPFSIASHNPFR